MLHCKSVVVSCRSPSVNVLNCAVAGDLVNYPSVQGFGGFVFSRRIPAYPRYSRKYPSGHSALAFSNQYLTTVPHISKEFLNSAYLKSVSRRSAMPCQKSSTIMLGIAIEILMLSRPWLPDRYMGIGRTHA